MSVSKSLKNRRRFEERIAQRHKRSYNQAVKEEEPKGFKPPMDTVMFNMRIFSERDCSFELSIPSEMDIPTQLAITKVLKHDIPLCLKEFLEFRKLRSENHELPPEPHSVT